MRRSRLILIILIVFAVIDGLAWWATIRLVNRPSPEELELAALVTPVLEGVTVAPRLDNFSQRVSLNGPWSYRQTGQEVKEEYFTGPTNPGWRTMELPQNWYLAGLNYHGVIWFRRSFQVDPAWQGRVVRLEFKGVDYLAEVYLNGVKLGRHEGYFQPFSFNVTHLLNYSGENELAVRVDSPYEEFRTVWPRQKTLIKGIYGQGKTHPGGSWNLAGQDLNTGGIWGEIELLASDFLIVEDFQLQASWPISESTVSAADLQVEINLQSYATTPVDATLLLVLAPRNFTGPTLALPAKEVTLNSGQNVVALQGVVADPHLWWIWDRGNPDLYTARLEVLSGEQLIAEKEVPFGFRQIQVENDWTWRLNGQRFFPRGASYISSQWLSETDEDWFRRDVALMRAANLNFMRVYGHVEPAAFYHVADELGMLVWQDFPLQWGYSDAPLFIDEAQRQMQSMIAMLFNHPSIAVWNVHNESPWAFPGMAQLVTDYDSRQNQRLDELLQKLAQQRDPTRYVHLNSGSRDAHVSVGWTEGNWRDYALLPGAPFASEYGVPALPGVETMAAIFAPEEHIFQYGEVRDRWEYHGFQSRQTFDVAGIEQGESLETFVANSQAYQANLLKFATETYRRAKYDPMQGIFQFLFADNWPAISWSVVDYHRQPKAGYYALQTAMQPILPSISAPPPERLDGQRWVYPASANLALQLWVVNDTLEEIPNATLAWQLTGSESVVDERNMNINIHPDSSQQKSVLRNLELPAGIYVLTAAIRSPQGDLLGSNQFEFEILAE